MTSGIRLPGGGWQTGKTDGFGFSWGGLSVQAGAFPVSTALVLSSPAKLNLSLAVVGRRADGYHDLVSLVSPLALADTLMAEPGPDGTASLSCDDPTLPVDASNLVLRAERVFRTRTGWKGGVRFHLVKRIPRGAGLGGGSSNATMALRALDQLAGARLGDAVLAELAAELGSDCPLFLFSGPVVLRGRGERVQPVAPEVAARVAGRPVWLFKPAWGIETPWSFRRLAAWGLGAYADAEEAEGSLAAWCSDPAAPLETLPGNTLERVAFGKYLALPALVAQVREELGLAVRMSGSGSCCFAFAPGGESEGRLGELTEALRRRVIAAWGDEAFFAASRLA